MDAGKRFEQNFHRSLKRLPGASMRILDGGKYSKLRVWGDFLFWADNGRDYLFECKSTHLKSLRFEQVKEHQLKSLAEFELTREDMLSFLAINFYDREKDLTGRTWLVPVADFLNLKEILTNEYGRSSVPMKALEEIYPECPRIPGSMWDFAGML